jgi:putative peptidoglycan lipid II flippase
MYPTLSHDAGKGNFQKFKNDFKNGCKRSLIYTTLAAIALAIFAKPIVFLLLGGGQFGASEIALLTSVLQIYCIAVPLESLMHAYHRAYYSLQNTIIPATLHAIIILGTIIVAKNLAPQIGVHAIPVSFSTGLVIQVILLVMIFPRVFQSRQKQH